MTNLDYLSSRYLELFHKVQKEKHERDLVMRSEEYQKWQEQFDMAKLMMEKLIGQLPDSKFDLEEIQEELKKEFSSRSITSYGSLQAETRKRKEVRGGELLNALSGDLDCFMSLAKVTQKSLAEYAKGQSDDFKKALLDCIHECGEEVVGFTIKQS